MSNRNYREEYMRRNIRSLMTYGLTYPEQRRVRENLPDPELILSLFQLNTATVREAALSTLS